MIRVTQVQQKRIILIPLRVIPENTTEQPIDKKLYIKINHILQITNPRIICIGCENFIMPPKREEIKPQRQISPRM